MTYIFSAESEEYKESSAVSPLPLTTYLYRCKPGGVILSLVCYGIFCTATTCLL